MGQEKVCHGDGSTDSAWLEGKGGSMRHTSFAPDPGEPSATNERKGGVLMQHADVPHFQIVVLVAPFVFYVLYH